MKRSKTTPDSQAPRQRPPTLKLVATITLMILILGALVTTNGLLQGKAEAFAIQRVTLARNTQLIKDYDVELSMSAQLAAAKKDLGYAIQYNQLAPELDRVLDETSRLDPSIDLKLLETAGAHRVLVAMDLRSFALDRAGKWSQASSLLSGQKYVTQEGLYQNGLDLTIASIEANAASIGRNSQGIQTITIGLGVFGLVVMVLMGLLVLRIARSGAREREAVVRAGETVKELELANSEITLIGKLGNLLQSCDTAAEAYAVIENAAGELFAGHPGALFLVNASRSLVEGVAEWGSPDLVDRVFPPMGCWALRSGAVHEVGPASGPVCAHVANNPGGYVCIPMTAQGETLGVLYLQQEPATAAHSSRLAVTVAEKVALCLANLGLRETLRTQSIRDPLTGMFNRRYMEESFERELRRAVRSGGSMGIMMADLDHFKRFNDDFGHEAGDIVLRAAGRLIMENSRTEDIACRFGGEELILIMPDSSLVATAERAELLRTLMEDLSVEHAGHSLGTVTMSIGVASVPENGSSIDELIATADKALYRAKSAGRNRVVIAEPRKRLQPVLATNAS